MDSPLDNPIWHALIGPHAAFARGSGLARVYPPDLAPYAAIGEASAEAYRDLASLLEPGREARMFRAARDSVPDGWEEIGARQIVQMVFEASRPPPGGRDAAGLRPLGPADDAAIHGLVAAAKPGPFERRTAELGHFVGIVEAGKLIGMAGERLRLAGYVELSAIAVHPTARGRGLATVLIRHLVRRALDRGETPFLHVYADNPAMALYERLGFRTRRPIWVTRRRPLAHSAERI